VLIYCFNVLDVLKTDMKRFKFTRVAFLVIIIFSGLISVSCDKIEIDNQKPVIKVIEPFEDEHVKPGDAVHFKVEFSDNIALASYKVNIHGAFDNHSHNSTVMSTRAATDSIAFEKTWMETEFITLGESPIAGKKIVTVEHQHIVIPTTIRRTVNGVIEEMPLREGHYHFIVYCTDESGQESFVAKEIFISNDEDSHQH
jgi:hypothetical protein